MNIKTNSKPISWLEAVKQLQAIAQTGLFYKSNTYESERYEQIIEICREQLSQYTNNSPEELNKFFHDDTGYITPKTDIRAVVFQDSKILMVQEKVDGKWTIPGGWADVGYTPNEIAVKETLEEAGLKVKPIRLLAVMDKKCHPHPPSPFYSYKIFILCEIIGGNLGAGSETIDAQFFELNNIPELSTERLTKDQLEILVELYNNPQLSAYCE